LSDDVREALRRLESADADVIGCAVVVRDRMRRREPVTSQDYAVLALAMAVDMRDLRLSEYRDACAVAGVKPARRAEKASPS
jgi:hypothetical protein